MSFKTLLFCLILLCISCRLSAQIWIPQLNKNGTYSLVTEAGKPVNQAEYEYISPYWGGTQYAYWRSKGLAGCVFPNKVSISFEYNRATYQTKMVKPVMEKDPQGDSLQEDFVYLVAYSSKNLLVNIKTGKYLVDDPNDEDRQALRLGTYFPMRDGLMKIHERGNWVNFVDQEFNKVFSSPIKNGEVVSPELFIAQDTVTKQYGLIDAKGRIVVPYLFGRMNLTPNENHVIVGVKIPSKGNYPNYKYGLLDKQGKLVLDTVYNEIKPFATNFYLIRSEDTSGVLNHHLEPVVPFVPQLIESTNDFYADKAKYLFIRNHWGRSKAKYSFQVMDSTGQIVFQENFDNYRLQQECNCLSLLKSNGERAVYNIQSGIQFSFQDTIEQLYCLDEKRDVFFVKRKKGELQLYTRKGDKLNTYPFDILTPLKAIDGHYIATKEDQVGVIDPSGKVIAPIQYDAVYNVPLKGRDRNITGFRTGANRQYGIYDQGLQKWKMFQTEEAAAEYLYPPEFEIIAGKNNQYGVVRTKGKTVIPAQYQFIKQMQDSPLFACFDQNTQKWSIVGADNKAVFTFDKTDDQHPPIANILKSNGDLAIQNGAKTLFLEKGSYKQLAYFDLIFVDGLCVASFEKNGWVTMFKPNEARHTVWANYITGKAYFAE